MIFEYFSKISAMRKLLLFSLIAALLISCSTSREARSSKAELRKEKAQTGQLLVKNAIESRKFIIKFNRLYGSFGAIFDLVPRANYLIVDGSRAVINTAYMGRQYDIKPIAGLDMKGWAKEYTVTNRISKGSYEIHMKVDNGGPNAFDVSIRISKGGYCNASISSLRIDNIRYSGYLVPIVENEGSNEVGGAAI